MTGKVLLHSFYYFRLVKNPFQIGDKKCFERIVRVEDTASFEGENVHPVYATFGLTRDAEWSSRLFVLEMKEPHEEGIGTFVEIQHLSPALVGEKVKFEAVLEEVKGNSVNCSFSAFVDNRKIAEGRTGQKIISKEKLEQIFSSLNNNEENES